MADPSPTDAAPESQEPQGGEGQEPAGAPSDDAKKAEGERSYPESYVKQLRREAATQRNRLSELEEQVQEFADRDKSQSDKLTEKLTTTEQRARDAESRALRYEVAAEHGLAMDAAKFLTGSTREEMELHAEELGKLLETRGSKPLAGFDGGARQLVPEHKPPAEAHNDLLLRSLGMRNRDQ